MSRLSGPNGSVMSFEPNKKLVNDYKDVSKENNYEKCSPINIFAIALSDTDSNKVLTVPATAMGSAYFGENGFTIPKWQSEYVEVEDIEVECKSLNTITDKRFDLIKIDIEGHEPQAFLGFSENTLNSKNIIVEVGAYSNLTFLKFLFDRYTAKRLNGVPISIEEILNLEEHQTNIWLQPKAQIRS
jgi:FkbM family methyltransferase